MKEKILLHIRDKDMKSLKDLLAKAEDIEIIHALHKLSPKEQVITFRLLNKESALNIFERLDTDQQQNLLRSFTDERVVEFINELPPDDRTRLLDELPASVAKKLIMSLSPKEREATNILMGYAMETAGHIMTTEFISLRRDMTVEEALKKIRSQALNSETIYTLYVTDDKRKLEGSISLKKLLISDSETKIEDIMFVPVISVSTGTDQEKVANTLKDLDLLALPVVDSENRIVGIVTIDDAIDILEEETTEDILDYAGFADPDESDRSKVLIDGNLWKIWRVRLPFLFITIAGGILAATVMEGFEQVLESIAVVAFFIPLIMDMGGTIGTQSSTVFARGIALGHINVKRFFKPFLKEVGVGLSIGLVSGIISGIAAALLQGMPILGLAVGIAVAATMTLAALLGFLVPYALIKFNFDQAAGSAPIITSIKDISGLLIYFVVVSMLLGHLI